MESDQLTSGLWDFFFQMLLLHHQKCLMTVCNCLFSGIQQKGSILLQALVAEQKSIDNVPVARQVAKALVTAMKKFRHDPNVLAEVSMY